MSVMAALGVDLLTRAAAEKDRPAAQRKRLLAEAASLRDGRRRRDHHRRVDGRRTRSDLPGPPRQDSARSAGRAQSLNADRRAAGVGAWYSSSPDPKVRSA